MRMASSLRPLSRQLLLLAARQQRGYYHQHAIPALSGSHTITQMAHYSGSKSASGPIPMPRRHCPRSANQILSSRHVTTDSKEMPHPSAEAKAKGRRIQVITGSLTALFGALYILYRQLNAEEGSKDKGEGQEEGGEEPGRKEVSVRVCVCVRG